MEPLAHVWTDEDAVDSLESIVRPVLFYRSHSTNVDSGALDSFCSHCMMITIGCQSSIRTADTRPDVALDLYLLGSILYSNCHGSLFQ